YVLRVLPALTASLVRDPTNISFWTIGPRILPGAPLAAELVSIACVALVLVLMLRWADQRGPLAPALALATAVMVLVSPLSWPFSLVIALMPAALLLGLLKARGYPLVPLVATLCVFGLLSIDQSQWYAVARAFQGAAVVWLLPSLSVALLAVLLR